MINLKKMKNKLKRAREADGRTAVKFDPSAIYALERAARVNPNIKVPDVPRRSCR
jgi:hypothetical protein